ncbi:MAG: hypothetical protein D3903_21510 [Candidatus Electrothrix sp. GM3_4]|nr:hypothetical protein [Candidatus Electrothrix sp. GM3_4]
MHYRSFEKFLLGWTPSCRKASARSMRFFLPVLSRFSANCQLCRAWFSRLPTRYQGHRFFPWGMKIYAVCHTVPAAGGKGKNSEPALSLTSTKSTFITPKDEKQRR